jgi:hypothetical protein
MITHVIGLHAHLMGEMNSWHAQWALGWMETEVLVIGFRWSHMLRILMVELLYLAAWSLLSVTF